MTSKLAFYSILIVLNTLWIWIAHHFICLSNPVPRPLPNLGTSCLTGSCYVITCLSWL